MSSTFEKTGRYEYERWQFEDFEDFMTEIETEWTAEQATAWGTERSSRNGPRDGWYGTDSWEQSVDFARQGWENGRQEFAELMDAMAPYVVAALGERSTDLAPAGYMPDVPSFCAGSPACMYTEGDQYVSRTPVLRMLVNIGGLGNVEAEAWMLRGAALCSIIDYFEQIGIRCEIELVSIAHGNGNRMVEVNVPVKRASEHVEPDRLSFALGNPSMLRRFVFSLREKSSKARLGRMYGASQDAEPDPDQIYFPKMRNYSKPEDAMRQVLKRVMEYMEPELKVRVGEDWEAILEPDTRAAF